MKKLDDGEKAQAAREEAERKRAEEQEKQESARIAQAAREADQRAWESAQRGNTEAAYQSYQANNPQGRYLAQAQTRLKELETDEAYRSETEHWQRVSGAKGSATVQGYLDRYPGGRYVSAAQTKLVTVKKEEAELRPGKVFKDCAECPEMVVIPAGSFEMGGNQSSVEKPIHSVSINKPFALGKTEITQGQWRAIMVSNPSHFSACGDDCPVEKVSWDDAQQYVRKLSQETGKTYRLPSEAEWEYACRAGGKHEYCGSDSVDSVAWYDSNSGNKTSQVARKQANAWGLHDMSGNVTEWVEDCLNDNYNGAPGDGSVWASGNCVWRVLRGGTWYGDPQYTRSAFRDRDVPSGRSLVSGFRPARMLP
jgi:formylglycine-generating enzyme required for sulfatase activity